MVTIETSASMYMPVGTHYDFTILMSYRAHDPWAVTLTFKGHNNVSTWVVSRELLAGKCENLGDFQIFRNHPNPTQATIFFPNENVKVLLSLKKLDLFLNETLNEVPWGEEWRTIHLDDEIENFFQN